MAMLPVPDDELWVAVAPHLPPKPKGGRPRVDDRRAFIGRSRWVVERSLAWFAQFCRLVVRYERHADIHLGFLTLAAVLITFRFVQRWFCQAL